MPGFLPAPTLPSVSVNLSTILTILGSYLQKVESYSFCPFMTGAYFTQQNTIPQRSPALRRVRVTFLWLNNTPLRTYIHHISVFYSVIDGHSGLLLLLEMVNNAAVNMGIYGSLSQTCFQLFRV